MSNSGRGVLAAFNRLRESHAAHATRVVRLVVRVGHDDHGPAGAKALSGRSDSPLVNDDGSAMEERGVGRVLCDADRVWERLLRTVALISADQQDGATLQKDCRLSREFVKGAGGEDGGRSERKYDGGLAG